MLDKSKQSTDFYLLVIFAIVAIIKGDISYFTAKL